jgi:hypothetical protein
MTTYLHAYLPTAYVRRASPLRYGCACGTRSCTKGGERTWTGVEP